MISRDELAHIRTFEAICDALERCKLGTERSAFIAAVTREAAVLDPNPHARNLRARLQAQRAYAIDVCGYLDKPEAPLTAADILYYRRRAIAWAVAHRLLEVASLRATTTGGHVRQDVDDVDPLEVDDADAFFDPDGDEMLGD